jgi:hypothetical protein
VAKDLVPKHIVYEEHGPTPVKQYLEKFGAEKTETFFRPDVLGEFDERKLYYLTDTHWTFKGAKQYLEAALRSAGLSEQAEALEKMTLRVDPLPFVGDLGRHIGHPGEIQEHILPAPSKATVLFHNRIDTEGRVFHFANGEAKNRLLLMMDSTGSWMLNYLAELFNDVMAVHASDIDWNFVMAYKPDLVLFVQCERFFTRPPNDNCNWGKLITENESRKNAPLSAVDYLHKLGLL